MAHGNGEGGTDINGGSKLATDVRSDPFLSIEKFITI